MGAAYLGEHRLLKRKVVIKILPDEVTSHPTFLERFEQQVPLLAQLDHPNILKIHNVASDKGKYFFVTDEVYQDKEAYQNLAQFIAGHTLEEDVIYDLLDQMASAFDYAHERGEAHLGLKMNNVIVKINEEKPKILLSDFGLAKLVGVKAILTQTYKFISDAIGLVNPYADNEKIGFLHNSYVQTFHFLAPEEKKGALPSPKADVFAFGVLAYYLLTGSYPEGAFDYPCVNKEYKHDWDQLIRSTMRSNPEERALNLAASLQSIKRASRDRYVAAEIEESALAVSSSAKHLKPIIRAQAIERPTYELDVKNPNEVESVVKQYQQERRVVNTDPILSDMSVIPGGTYMQGSNEGHRDEMPRHQIHLDSFAMDVHPVTNDQFVRFLETMGGEKDHNHQDIIRLKDSRIKRSAGRLVIESGYTKHPVVGVTWYGAMAYAKWVGKRLPTESEWEIASRGGNENALFPTGAFIEKTMANFFSSDTTPVMSYPCNPYGLFDMAGNVYEWCSDWYAYNYYEISQQEPINPKGPLQGVYRVLRGGCWKSLKEDLSCSRRHRNNPGAVNGTYGFRCCADVQ
jgi:formylglycine-generating enzyme required for sulfatase activity